VLSQLIIGWNCGHPLLTAYLAVRCRWFLFRCYQKAVYFGAPDHRARCGAEKGHGAPTTATEKGDTPTLELPFLLS